MIGARSLRFKLLAAAVGTLGPATFAVAAFGSPAYANVCDVGNLLSRACYSGHVQTLLSANGNAIPNGVTPGGDYFRWAGTEYGGVNQLTEVGIEITPQNVGQAYTQTLMPNGTWAGNTQVISGGTPSKEQFDLTYNGPGDWNDTVYWWIGTTQYQLPYQFNGTGIDGGAIAEDGFIFIGNINDGSSTGTWTSPNFQITANGVGTVTQWNGDVIDDPCSPGAHHCLNGQWNPAYSGWNANEQS